MRSLPLCFLSLACGLFLQASEPVPVKPASPVDVRIADARKQVEANPKSATAYNQLATALIRKGRDYQDDVIYREATTALDKSLSLSPANYDARKLQVAVFLGTDKPAEALKLETDLNRHLPDDIAGWALLAEANAALGNYEQAEHAAQWVLDLRPGSAIGFEEAAELRAIFGDAEGSIEFFEEANRRSSQNDLDQRSWLLTQKARLLLLSGNSKAAESQLAEAMRLFPDSQQALAALAQVRQAQGQFHEAANLLETRYRRVPSAANLYDWAEALAKAGQAAEAATAFRKFEAQAVADKNQNEVASLSLIKYYNDTKMNPAEALALAEKRMQERHDVATLDVYAWALFRNGKFADAKLQMDKALGIGVRNAEYLCHAARIAAVAKDNAAAERYAKEAEGMPAGSCPAEAAMQTASEVRP